MKKGHGLKRALHPIAREQLEGMATGALLARLKRLRWCEDSREWSDMSDEEVASASDMILFKTDQAWRSAYHYLREVLGKRDHLPNTP